MWRGAVQRALLVLGAAALAQHAHAQLTLGGARCGELSCERNQYCSPETSRCAPCADVCEQVHHNYDAALCFKLCQDYIHELRFVSRTAGGGAGSAASEAEIKTADGQGSSAEEEPNATLLTLQVKAALITSSVLLALVLLTCLFKCWSYTKNNRNKFSWKYIKQKWPLSNTRVKQYPPGQTHHNPHAEMANKMPKRELKLEIRGGEPAVRQQPLDAHELATATAMDKSPRTISTCVSSRHPAEDTTLDYSYDNMALNVTPPPAVAAVQHF